MQLHRLCSMQDNKEVVGMKKYIKPELVEAIVSANTSIANGGLSGWLDDNEMGKYEDSITTYQYNS